MCLDPPARSSGGTARPPHHSLATVASFVLLELFHVAGSAVSAYDPGRNGETSLNPAWRGAALHAVFGASWALNATLGEQAALAAGVSDLTGVLRSALPESGATGARAMY